MQVAIFMDMPLYPYRIYAYNELASRGYKLTVFSIGNKNEAYEIPLYFEHKVFPFKKIGPFVLVKGFNIKEYDKYDIVIIPSNFRMIDYYGFLRKRFRSRTIRWGHLTGRTHGHKIAEKVRLSIFKKCPALIFYDYETRDNYIVHGFDNNKLFVANNTQFVDISTIHPHEKRYYFIYVGRIQERKGIDLALKSFALLKRESNDPNLEFLIVGGGDATNLKQLAEKEQIVSSVKFLGPIHEQDQLGILFSHAMAYVSPGHVGLGVLHSFACGVPVITCSGRLHSVEFSNCNTKNSVVVPYTVESVYGAMKKLYKDNEYQEMIAENAYEYYWNNCTIDKMVDGIENAIKYIEKGQK